MWDLFFTELLIICILRIFSMKICSGLSIQGLLLIVWVSLSLFNSNMRCIGLWEPLQQLLMEISAPLNQQWFWLISLPLPSKVFCTASIWTVCTLFLLKVLKNNQIYSKNLIPSSNTHPTRNSTIVYICRFYAFSFPCYLRYWLMYLMWGFRFTFSMLHADEPVYCLNYFMVSNRIFWSPFPYLVSLYY